MEAAALQTLKYAVEDGVATLTMNRPAQKNALDTVMRTEMAEVLAAARRDRGIHALILTGAGGAFCAGGDIRGMRNGDPSAEDGRNRMLDLHLWVEELISFDRPVIAAVDGPAYGAGFGLALAADFVLATPRARFCLSFLKLGLIPDCGVFYTLPRIVGLQRAKELAFSAREIDAEEAKQFGIVSEIHDAELLAERARRIALSFNNASLTALSITKRAFNASINTGLGALLEMEAAGQGVARSSDYHRNAAAAFLNKEAPPFSWPK
ncbi:enoyl-CoA hydratase/isomerase family protein [Noviherbaspirillum malthae]|uniref:enoyl-CoA hydratase/isomerase family protein n=1 Tax=Noviherbaspirillum malthae TaxID=1260987 RepID=UPI001E371611|nr:enoyl-CoA hydratase/isomerase family protein [Noviherbaspirillum malthae]